MQLPTEQDLDVWLTNLPDEELQTLNTITDQMANDNITDEESLTHIIALVLHFYGKPASVEQITELIPQFAMCLALEHLRRQGTVIKQGRYSIRPNALGATFLRVEKQGE